MIVEKYFQAFAKRDLRALEELLTDDVTLQDPFVGILRGKAAVLELNRSMFSGPAFDLEVRRTWSRGAESFVVEFSLTLDPAGVRNVIGGVDCFELWSGRIASIRAYLDTGPITG